MKRTIQEAVNYSVEQVILQGCQSSIVKEGCPDELTVVPNCLYRGPNNTKCAVGFLIDDEDYIPEWDTQFGISTKDLFDALDYKMFTDDVNRKDAAMIMRSLQRAHDSCDVKASFVHDFKEAVGHTCRAHSLDVPEAAV